MIVYLNIKLAHAMRGLLYSYMGTKVFADTSESVDEVLVRVFLLSFPGLGQITDFIT